jgi:transglutaminase-like putative cysteine protease
MGLDAAPFGRLIPIAEGLPGALQTLEIMRRMIAAPEDGIVADVAGHFRADASRLGLTDRQLAVGLFDWVRARFRYREDDQLSYDPMPTPQIEETIQRPGMMLRSLLMAPSAAAQLEGDCDDYAVLLGSLYHALGWPVVLVAVSTNAHGTLDHVYLKVRVAGRWEGADAIPDAAGRFWWEPGAADGVTSRVEWAV